MSAIKITKEHYRIAEQNGISKNTLFRRVRKSGWDIEKAITHPVLTAKERGYLGKPKRSLITEEQWEKAQKLGLKYSTIYRRIQSGISPEDACTTAIRPNRYHEPKEEEPELIIEVKEIPVKNIHRKINDLIDAHEDYVNCKGCSYCEKIKALRQYMERSPIEKNAKTLIKRDQMTKTELLKLLNSEVQMKDIYNSWGMSEHKFRNLLALYGFKKDEFGFWCQ